MRPPQFAGEDSGCRSGTRGRWTYFNEAPAVRGGRYRPRAGAQQSPVATSMRPPQFAGEDVQSVDDDMLDALTSMRPPQFAGEDLALASVEQRIARHFNEAPAVRGGRSILAIVRQTVNSILQ